MLRPSSSTQLECYLGVALHSDPIQSPGFEVIGVKPGFQQHIAKGYSEQKQGLFPSIEYGLGVAGEDRNSQDYSKGTAVPIGSLVVPFWDYLLGF